MKEYINNLKEDLINRKKSLANNRMKMGVSLETIKSESFNAGLQHAISYFEKLDDGSIARNVSD